MSAPANGQIEAVTGDYEVGRGKPPVHSRFKPGQSGNRRGRPKGSKSGRALLTDELNKPVEYSENGKRGRTTKQGAIMKRVVNKAMSGELKPLIDLLKLYGLDVRTEDAPTDTLDSPDDLESRASLFRRLRGKA